MTHAQDDGPATGVQLDKAVRRGTRAVLAAQVGSQLVSIVTLAVLYRLVEPAEFGLMGMAVPLLLLAQMFASFGLNVAAVQQQQELSHEQATGIFWANLAFALGGAAAVAAAGPLLARAYSAPRLSTLCVALAASLLVAAAGAQHRALVERRLLIGRLVAGRLIAQATGGLFAIAAAFAGAGVWALVVHQYVELSVLSLASWFMIDWRPGSPRQGRVTRELLGFGGAYWLSSVMFYVAQNVDKILIAALFGHSRAGQVILGLYAQSYNLVMKPVALVAAPLTAIMLPALSRARKRPEQYGALVADFYRMVAIALAPSAIGLLLVADLVMVVLGGNAWRPAGTLLRAMALGIFAQGLINIAGSVLASAGKAHALFRASAVVAALHGLGYGAAIGIGTSMGQIPDGPVLAMAWSYSLVLAGVLLIPYLSYCFSAVGVPFRRVRAVLIRPVAASIAMGVVVGGLRIATANIAFPPGVRLVMLIAAGVATYALASRRDCRWLWEQLSGTAREV